MIENLNFSRDRLVESYMCAVGLAYEPKHSCFRKWLTKVVIFILVIDDIYDIYGSLEELQQFTNAVERFVNFYVSLSHDEPYFQNMIVGQ